MQSRFILISEGGSAMTYHNPKMVMSYARDSGHPAEQDFESIIIFLATMILLGFVGYLLFHYIVPCFMDSIVDFFYNSPASWEKLLHPYN
jgi:hypothetical protein